MLLKVPSIVWLALGYQNLILKLIKLNNILRWFVEMFDKNIVSWGLYYKNLRTRNLRKMESFRSNIVSFLLLVTFTGLDKHTSLDKRTSLLRNP
jgi:hypothetical protein